MINYRRKPEGEAWSPRGLRTPSARSLALGLGAYKRLSPVLPAVARPQRIDRVRNPHPALLCPQVPPNLDQAPHVRGEHRFRPGCQDVLRLAPSEPFG